MKAPQPDFKRKLHRHLRTTTGAAAITVSFFLLAAGSVAPNMYTNFFSTSDAENAARDKEIQLLEKRIDTIGPMYRYVNGLKQQADIVLKLPQDALPPGTNPDTMRRNGEKLDAALQAEINATTYAVWLSPTLRRRDTLELEQKLDAAAGRKTGEAFNSGDLMGTFHATLNFRECKADIRAQPGFKEDQANVRKAIDCAIAKAKPTSAALKRTGYGLAFIFLAAGLYRRRLGKQIEAEDAAAKLAASQPAPPPPPPQPPAPIVTTTGKDITIKPIKIAKSAAL